MKFRIALMLLIIAGVLAPSTANAYDVSIPRPVTPPAAPQYQEVNTPIESAQLIRTTTGTRLQVRIALSGCEKAGTLNITGIRVVNPTGKIRGSYTLKVKATKQTPTTPGLVCTTQVHTHTLSVKATASATHVYDTTNGKTHRPWKVTATSVRR